jgi:hypothetical protein
MNQLISMLFSRAAKNWRKMDSYLDILYCFCVHSADEIELEEDATKAVPVDPTSEAYQVGMELYFKMGLLTMFGDFVLQEESPLWNETDDRAKMGTTSSISSAYSVTPNFSSLLKLITTMISDEAMVAKYPLNEVQTQMVKSQGILSKMMEPGDGDHDFTDLLCGMAKNNGQVSEQMAEAYLKGVSKSSAASVAALASLQKLLAINDNLKRVRMEWVLGVPQMKFRQNIRTRQ